jgi:hypothetical protein
MAQKNKLNPALPPINHPTTHRPTLFHTIHQPTIIGTVQPTHNPITGTPHPTKTHSPHPTKTHSPHPTKTHTPISPKPSHGGSGHGSGTTGSSGSTFSNFNFPPAWHEPIQTAKSYHPYQQSKVPYNTHGQYHCSCCCSQGIVAIVALSSNVTAAGITAITAMTK